MLSKLLQLWDTLKSSYWFLPSIMCTGAFFAAIFMTQNHRVLAPELLDSISWLYHSTPDGARSVMSTIAGSMITVAGVTFSITIASVAYATTQFGPRLLTNFMSDRGNQFTLGTFIATFLYCLLVLRTITNSNSADNTQAFVPHLAIVLGVGFAIASVGVLIYFIHHVPASIHASNVISSVGQQLICQLDRLYPNKIGDGKNSDSAKAEPGKDPEPAPSYDLERSRVVHANFDGYVQFVDAEKIFSTAMELDAVMILNARPGDFVTHGEILAWICTDRDLDDTTCDTVCAAFLHGDRRTPAQDVMFLANELVEIAARAMSPGTNDPFTAINCMDWLSGAFSLLAKRESPACHQYDEEGKLRVVSNPVTFLTFLHDNINRLRPYVATDRNAALHLQSMYGRLILGTEDKQLQALFIDLDTELLASAKDHLGKLDIEKMQARHGILLELHSAADVNMTLAHQHRWLGGSA